MDRSAYLLRICVEDHGLAADESTLRLLQRQHLLNVPFENLDIHWRRPITLQLERFYRKIVENRRGGFCYELNGLFNELLTKVGFESRLVSARVGDGQGNFSDEYDHAAIIVKIGENRYLADVGFGEFASEPLKVVCDIEQNDSGDVYVLRQLDDGYIEVIKREDGRWSSQYAFTFDGRRLSEFADRCEFQQFSPESHFLKGKICSQMTRNGRKTLNDNKFILSEHGARTESYVNSEDEFNTILMKEFGIDRNAYT
jgi:N-hydroxyarylamine O-acetyltransferase